MANSKIWTWLPIVALLNALFLVSSANAVTILAGSDHLETLDGTFFVFPLGGSPTSVPMMGLPLPGLAPADTVVRRLENASCATDGSGTPVACLDPGNDPTPQVIDIEIVALSLRSVDPVDLDGGGNDGHLVVLLSDHASSTGGMTIRHDNNGVDEGTFDSFFDVFFDVFIDVGLPDLIPIADAQDLTHRFESFGSQWSATPPPGALLVQGPIGDLAANDHIGKSADQIDLYVLAVQEFVPNLSDPDNPLAVHQASSATVPEPGTLGLFGIGLVAFIGLARARRRYALK